MSRWMVMPNRLFWSIVVGVLVYGAGCATGDTLFKKDRRVAIGWVIESEQKGIFYWKDCSDKTLKEYKQPPYWVKKEDNCKPKEATPLGGMGNLYRPNGLLPSFITNFFWAVGHLFRGSRTSDTAPLVLTV